MMAAATEESYARLAAIRSQEASAGAGRRDSWTAAPTAALTAGASGQRHRAVDQDPRQPDPGT